MSDRDSDDNSLRNNIPTLGSTNTITINPANVITTARYVPHPDDFLVVLRPRETKCCYCGKMQSDNPYCCDGCKPRVGGMYLRCHIHPDVQETRYSVCPKCVREIMADQMSTNSPSGETPNPER